MNDSEAGCDDDLPEWSWKIIDKHGLGERSDTPMSAVTVLLFDSAYDLQALSQTAFQEQALTSENILRLTEIIVQLEDARKLSVLCPKDAKQGVVTESDNGTLRWDALDRLKITPIVISTCRCTLCTPTGALIKRIRLRRERLLSCFDPCTNPLSREGRWIEVSGDGAS